MGITDYTILRTEKFGSRDKRKEEENTCFGCGEKIDTDDEPCMDDDERLFCSEDCFLKYYGYRKLKFGEY